MLIWKVPYFYYQGLQVVKNEMDVKEELKRQVSEGSEMECQLVTNN